MLWVLICTVHLTVCSYHGTYALQSESPLYSCLKLNELFGRSKCEIWNLSDCNETRTHNDLVRKRTLNHLAKLAKWLHCRVSTYLYLSELSGCGFEFPCSHLNFRFRVCLEQGFLDIQATIKCGFTLKWVRGWVLVQELNACGFESRYSSLNLRFCACFEQGVPWHSGNYRGLIHYEMRTWHDKNIHTNAPYR